MARKFFSTGQQQFLRRFDQNDPIDLVGGKGQSLQQLCSIGAPVPEGFILTTRFCAAFLGSTPSLSEACAKTLDQLQASFGCGTLIVVAIIVIILLIILAQCANDNSGSGSSYRSSGSSYGGSSSSSGGHK